MSKHLTLKYINIISPGPGLSPVSEGDTNDLGRGANFIGDESGRGDIYRHNSLCQEGCIRAATDAMPLSQPADALPGHGARATHVPQWQSKPSLGPVCATQ